MEGDRRGTYIAMNASVTGFSGAHFDNWYKYIFNQNILQNQS